MSKQLIGRWGPYDPKTPEDKKKARIQAQKRRESQAMQQAWLDKHKSCMNGCGKPVAFYKDSPSLALKHGGCCSLECSRAACGRSKHTTLGGAFQPCDLTVPLR